MLGRSPFLAALASVASAHHERLDGSGYHRGAAAGALAAPGAPARRRRRLPRHDRAAAAPRRRFARARRRPTLGREASAGRLDADAVAAVLEAAGQPVPRMERPAGLTEREAEVIGLLARGLQTKQVARALGISAKTADRHIQNAYAQDRRLDARGGGAVRDGARARGVGRTPDWRRARPRVASLAANAARAERSAA